MGQAERPCKNGNKLKRKISTMMRAANRGALYLPKLQAPMLVEGCVCVCCCWFVFLMFSFPLKIKTGTEWNAEHLHKALGIHTLERGGPDPRQRWPSETLPSPAPLAPRHFWENCFIQQRGNICPIFFMSRADFLTTQKCCLFYVGAARSKMMM